MRLFLIILVSHQRRIQNLSRKIEKENAKAK